jgi:membrane-associated phospholipid phosphatase
VSVLEKLSEKNSVRRKADRRSDKIKHRSEAIEQWGAIVVSQALIDFATYVNFSILMRSKLLSLLSTIRLLGLCAAAFSIWLFAEIADEVLEQETTTLDTQILLALKNLHSPLLDQIMTGITFLGEPISIISLCLLFGGILWKQGRRAEATTIAIAAGGSALLNYILKGIFSRSRPALWDRIVDVGYYSFPSGHAMVSLVMYGILGYLMATRFPKWRLAIAVLTMILVGAIGLSRLYLGVHWPTDVIAGYTAGIVWLVTCILSLQVWRIYRSAKANSQELNF